MTLRRGAIAPRAAGSRRADDVAEAAPRSPRRRPAGARSKTVVWLIAAAGLMALTACSAAPRSGSKEEVMEYLDTLRRLEAAGLLLEPGSEEERRAIERFRSLLSDFKAADFRDRIREVYAADAFFNDTLKTVRGVDELEEYLAATADAIETGTVDFLDLVVDNGNYYFRWLMTVRFKRLARGRETVSVGMTHVRFDADGRVALHQDYWDSAGGLFEHVPALGWMLRRAKRRL